MRLVLVVFVGIIVANVAWGAVYEWVDNKGVVNMTDDPDKVPAAYRKTMKARDIDTRDLVSPVTDTQKPPVDIIVGPSPQTNNLGGHDEGWWRSSFKNARLAVARLQDQIENSKKNLTELHRQRVLYQRPSDRVAYFKLADDITQDEERLKALNDELSRLSNQADVAGVPSRWRQ